MSTMESGKQPDYVPAQKAIELLGIKPQTLYAYVARGWIRAVAQEGTHQKLYARDDVERVRLRSVARSGHGPVAAGALRWGEPVISSAITEITADGPRYRTQLATELARLGRPFEAAADLLWTGMGEERDGGWKFDAPPAPFYDLANDLAERFPQMRFRDMLATLVQLLSATQSGNPETELGAIAPAGRQIIHVLAGAFARLRGGPLLMPEQGEPVAHLLARALGVPREYQLMLDAALIVSADHELAPATFAARVAASAGANLNACVLAGIAAFEGPLTGLGADGVEDLVGAAPTKLALLGKFKSAREQGRQVPGFNHPLYPKGDPRAMFLLDAVARLADPAPSGSMLASFIAEAPPELEVYPSLPVGLVAVQLALNLPPRSAGALFLLGRIAGYVAHVQEQRLAGFLLRPRAKFFP